MLYVALSATQAQAGDADTERENLARIASEIERVQVMVSEAAQTAPTGERVKFRYDWLLRDLGHAHRVDLGCAVVGGRAEL